VRVDDAGPAVVEQARESACFHYDLVEAP
jgi:hypothetical protein